MQQSAKAGVGAPALGAPLGRDGPHGPARTPHVEKRKVVLASRDKAGRAADLGSETEYEASGPETLQVPQLARASFESAGAESPLGSGPAAQAPRAPGDAILGCRSRRIDCA